MVNNGELVKVKHGLYRDAQISGGDNWGEVCRIIPSGVICMFSAWQYYKLTTHIPSMVHVAVANKQKILLPDYPLVKLYYWSIQYQSITKLKPLHNDENIIIYDLEK